MFVRLTDSKKQRDTVHSTQYCILCSRSPTRTLFRDFCTVTPLVVLAVVSYLGHSKKILIDWLIDWSITAAAAGCFRLLLCSPVSKLDHIECDWGRKSKENFSCFHPLKLREAWAQCLSELYKFGLGPNIWYTFDEASSGHTETQRPTNICRSALIMIGLLLRHHNRDTVLIRQQLSKACKKYEYQLLKKQI